MSVLTNLSSTPTFLRAIYRAKKVSLIIIFATTLSSNFGAAIAQCIRPIVIACHADERRRRRHLIDAAAAEKKIVPCIRPIKRVGLVLPFHHIMHIMDITT